MKYSNLEKDYFDYVVNFGYEKFKIEPGILPDDVEDQDQSDFPDVNQDEEIGY